MHIDKSQFNVEQKRAVEHGEVDSRLVKAGPLLVIAGAGTGKTKTIAHRVSYLISHGVDPNRILLLTFSRRAAAEMTSRVKRIARRDDKGSPINFPWAGTFHAIGAKLLRM